MVQNSEIMYLTEASTDWLTCLLMPSESHNARTAKATGLISSLIHVFFRLATTMLKNLPFISLIISQNITHYSFTLNLLFQNNPHLF